MSRSRCSDGRRCVRSGVYGGRGVPGGRRGDRGADGIWKGRSVSRKGGGCDGGDRRDECSDGRWNRGGGEGSRWGGEEQGGVFRRDG